MEAVEAQDWVEVHTHHSFINQSINQAHQSTHSPSHIAPPTSEIDAGLGFFSSVSAAVEADRRSGAFAKPERGFTVPRQAVNGSAYQGISWRMKFGMALAGMMRRIRGMQVSVGGVSAHACPLHTRLRDGVMCCEQDVQVKWAVGSLGDVVKDSRFLRNLLGPKLAEEV